MGQTVYIIDDDEAVRDSIKELVESVDLKAKTFSNAQAFLEIYTGEFQGCLVLDIRMAKMSGLVMQEKLQNLGSTLPIIFITGHGDIDMAVQTLKAGAVDFIQKPYHEQNLLDSINNALQVDSEIRNKFDGADDFSIRSVELTPREQEILSYLHRGQTNKGIAKELGISPRTVEVHRQHILNKYEVNSVSELIYRLNNTKS